MNPEPLPPDLRELEDRLARRPCPEPAADLRARILGAVAGARTPPETGRAGRRWRLAWAAAAVVLAPHLGMSVANGVRFGHLSGTAPERASVEHQADVRDPFDRLAASALAGLTPAPDVGPLGRSVFSNEEERRWAMP